MKFDSEVFGDVVVVHTPEDLNEDQAEALEEFVRGLPQRFVVLDLDGAESISGRGLEAILNIADIRRAELGDLRVTTTNHVNRKILEITRLDATIEVLDSVVDAVRGLS